MQTEKASFVLWIFLHQESLYHRQCLVECRVSVFCLSRNTNRVAHKKPSSRQTKEERKIMTDFLVQMGPRVHDDDHKTFVVMTSICRNITLLQKPNCKKSCAMKKKSPQLRQRKITVVKHIGNFENKTNQNTTNYYIFQLLLLNLDMHVFDFSHLPDSYKYLHLI